MLKYFFVSCLILFSTVANAGMLKMRISADILHKPDTVLEGNIGKTILYENANGSFFGGTVYSAFLGDAGGLFIGGFEVGQKISVGNNNFIEAAVFFGGGGGAGVVGGDGMLLRPRLMVGQKFGKYELSVGGGYMNVTGSNISSPFIEIAMSQPLNWLLENGHVSKCTGCKLASGSKFVTIESVGASFKNYIPITKLAPGKRSGRTLKPFYLAGSTINLNMQNMWGEGWQSFISASGAMAGDAEGYAEVLIGGQYGYNVADWARIYADAAVGFAGGGDVDTGGGTIVAANIGARWKIFNTVELETSIGYVAALSGGFYAVVPSVKLNLPLGAFDKDGQLNATNWSITTGYSIIPEHENMRYPHDTDRGFLGLTDFKADLYVTDNIYMTGQALSVTQGGAGGFAIGLVGVGATMALTEKIDVSAELLLGAAAGGAINVNGGLVGSAQLDVDYKLNDSLSLTSNFGWIKAIKGGMNGPLIGAGVKFNFSSFR